MSGSGDYISRNATIEAMYKDAEAHQGHTFWTSQNWALRNIPAADVRPVVRGTWVGIDDFPHEDWECNHCGCVVGNTDDPWNYYHFCPNCGADMRPTSMSGANGEES